MNYFQLHQKTPGCLNSQEKQLLHHHYLNHHEKKTQETLWAVHIPLETFIRYMHKQVKLICSELSKLPDTNYKVVIIKDTTSANTGLRILYSFMFHFRIWTVGWTKETMSGKS